jgi:pyruvate/2-oxoglutarate dehydrogenase complex dihydrolipoamide dehydrogenase (E3) component
MANIDQLDLSAAEVDHVGGRIELDRFLRSVSNSHVHVCGDAVANSPQLSPIATYEGHIVGRNIAEGPRHTPDYSSVPNAVYTVPALASLGLTEKAARQKGLRIKSIQGIWPSGFRLERMRRPQRGPKLSSTSQAIALWAPISSGIRAKN